jgi:hypothetical protein
VSRSPFVNGQNTPLELEPYNSRIGESEFRYGPSPTGSKNYVLIGFRPGYALQASELNEIQEQFFLQQTLTVTMISNWAGASVTTGPGWGSNDTTNLGGLTPLSPNMVTALNNVITFSAGWYLAQIPTYVNSQSGNTEERNFKVWVYLEENKTISYTNGETDQIGFNISQEYVTAEEDNALYDNSLSTTNQVLGSNRYQIVINGLVKQSSFNNSKFPMAVSVSNGNVSYLNGYSIV